MSAMGTLVAARPGEPADTAAIGASPAAPRSATGSDAIAVYRTVSGLMLLSLLWKMDVFVVFYHIYAAIPLRDPFFPSPLQSNALLAVCYLTAVALGFGVYATRSWRFLQLQSIVSCLALFVLCIHQGSYNDVTFVTAWWTSLWCVWFARRAAVEDYPTLMTKGSFLAQIMLAMILLGGGVGKWTSEYWSGEVLFEIYFRDRDFWIFNFLRGWASEEMLRWTATWYSRGVVIIESGCFVALWCLPRRLASILAMTVFASVGLFSNFSLFSVLFSTIGLAMVGLFPTQQTRSKSTASGVRGE